MTEKIKPTHVNRKAILYIRQSSPQQVMHNQESRRLQYAMKERLVALGWKSVEVIDEDLGKSAGGSIERSGFQRMVADVSLAKVGVVAGRELSRFARNSRDWQQLIEVCRVVDTLLLDEEAVYDARQSNDRLLLGLKGSLSEYELDLLRQRSQKAREQKASRAELGMNAPVGYVNAGDGRQEKTPDQRVQQAVQTVFEKFLELGTARQVLMWFVDHNQQMPYARHAEGEWNTCWRAATYHSILRILKHPIYAGAYTWGRTASETVLADGRPRRVNHRKQLDQWRVLRHDHHEGYVTWKTYERIQEMIRKNAQVCAPVHVGAAKRGPGLLTGLIRCRRCGKKLRVRYTGAGSANVLRYVCHRGFDGCGDRRCITFGGQGVDDAVVKEVLRVIQPGAVEAALLAGQEAAQRNDQGFKALELELRSLQYEADRAQRQYDATEPENRLVAAELERRWNVAMERVDHLQRRCDEQRRQQAALDLPSAEVFQSLAQDVRSVWDDPGTDVRLKKRIIRTLIEEVIADVDAKASDICLVVHWKGGTHTELRLARRRSGQCRHHVSKDVVDSVRTLARICRDDAIAAWLTRNGVHTSSGNSWTRQQVTGLRHRHNIAVHEAERQLQEGWMNLSEAAVHLSVDRRTLREAIERGEIKGLRPLTIGPWVLKRDDLDTDACRSLIARIERHRRRPGRRVAAHETPCLFSESSSEAL
jgi:DNA invertase Pin-like site-specific DNA recombinase